MKINKRIQKSVTYMCIIVALIAISVVVYIQMLREGWGDQVPLLATVLSTIGCTGIKIVPNLFIGMIMFMFHGMAFYGASRSSSEIFRQIVQIIIGLCAVMPLAVAIINRSYLYSDHILSYGAGIFLGYGLKKGYAEQRDVRDDLRRVATYWRNVTTFVFCGVLIFISLQFLLPYGVIRLSSGSVSPCFERMSGDLRLYGFTVDQERSVYKLDQPDTVETLVNDLIKKLDISENNRWQHMAGFSEESYMQITDETNGTFLIVWSYLGWHYIAHTPYYATDRTETADCIYPAESLLEKILREDETAQLVSVSDEFLDCREREGPFQRLTFTISSSNSNVKYWGNTITIDVADGRVFGVLSSVKRYLMQGNVPIVSWEKAYQYSRMFSDGYDYRTKETGWQMSDIQADYICYGVWLLPAYNFTFDLIKDGEIIKRSGTVVDAVQRIPF